MEVNILNKMKFGAVFMALITSISVFNISYAAGDEGWTISYVDGDSDKIDRNTYYAKITDNSDLEPGENLVMIDYGGTEAEYGKESYVELFAELTGSLVAGDEYTLSFLSKGYFSKSGKTGFAQRHSGMAEFKIGNELSFTINDLTKTALENDWYSYSKTFTYSGTENNLKIRVYGALGGNNKSVFDNISLKDSTGAEFVKNSGFALPESAPEDYYATGFYSYPDAGKAKLGWVNPKARELLKVALYERVGKERILLKDDFTTQTGADVHYSFGSVDEGTTLNTRLFEIEFAFRNKEPYVYYLTLAPTDKLSVKEGLGFDWSVGKNTENLMTAARYSYRRADDNPHSGNSYMNMGLADGTGSLDISCILSMPLRSALEMGEKYKISLYYRTDNTGFASHLTLGRETHYGAVGTLDGYQEVWNTFTDGGVFNKWTLYEKEITASVDATILFFIHYHNRLDIDDVSICKINEDGTLGDNLVLYGDCEGLQSTEVGAVTDAELKDIGTHNMTLSYRAEENISYINMYKKQDDEYIFCGKISPTQEEIYIDGLDLSTEYTYRLLPFNADGVEGEGVDVTATTTMPDYTITGQALMKNGREVFSISGSGIYEVKTVVTDYKVNDMKYAQVVAVYKDNTLQKLYVSNHSFEAEGKTAQGKTIKTTDIEIGGGTGWSVELYMWDGVETMEILSPNITFGK